MFPFVDVIMTSRPNKCQYTIVQIMFFRLHDTKLLSEPVLDYCQLSNWEQISVKFGTKHNSFHTRKMSKWIWKCRMQNMDHFEWWWLWGIINPFGNEVGIFRAKYVNIMVADVLFDCVSRSSGSMVMTTCVKYMHEEGFPVTALSVHEWKNECDSSWLVGG